MSPEEEHFPFGYNFCKRHKFTGIHTFARNERQDLQDRIKALQEKTIKQSHEIGSLKQKVSYRDKKLKDRPRKQRVITKEPTISPELTELRRKNKSLKVHNAQLMKQNERIREENLDLKAHMTTISKEVINEARKPNQPHNIVLRA